MFTKWLKRYEIEFMYHKQLQNIKKKKNSVVVIKVLF